MKTIYIYLTKEILKVAFSTTLVLTFLMVIGNMFKEVFEILLTTDVSLLTVLQLVFLLVPFTLTYSLPWGVLLGVLLVFGRFSQDQELTALKSAGIGLLPIIAPALWVAVIFSFISFLINAHLAPQSRKAFREIAFNLVNENPTAFFVEQKPITKFNGWRIWIAGKHGNVLEDVHIWQIGKDEVPINSIRASRGEIKYDPRGRQLVLDLYDARQEQRNSRLPTDVTSITVGASADKFPVPIPIAQFFEKKDKVKSSWMTLGELGDFLSNPLSNPDLNRIPFLLELQKRFSMSIACFTFTLVGIPLALQTQRRETSIGIALSLAVVVGYWCIVAIAEAMKTVGSFYPELIIWAPNLIFQALGCFLLWRANFRM